VVLSIVFVGIVVMIITTQPPTLSHEPGDIDLNAADGGGLSELVFDPVRR
jgi:hypothetical protein